MKRRNIEAVLLLGLVSACGVDPVASTGVESDVATGSFALQADRVAKGKAGCAADAPHGKHAEKEKGSAHTGKYRNMFRELGYSKAEIRARLEAVYQQLFHGDPESEAVYYEAGANEQGPLAQIRDIGNGDVRSEGMSYGMMISVQLDKKAEFDALWNWAQTYMKNNDPTHPGYRYYAWALDFEGTPRDTMSAPDGEEYFATALYFAAGRWGNGSGIYDYLSAANDLVDAMKNRPDIANGTTLFNTEEKQVRFTPNIENFETNGDHTDPSYHLPAFYELWAEWGARRDRRFWQEAAEVSRDFFVATTNPTTGLCPDYANFDGTPKAASWDDGTVNFRFDAFRTAMNWSVDWAWFRDDPRERVLSDRLQAFFESQGPSYVANYTLDGEPLVDYGSTGLVAMNGVASLAATDPRASDFVQALWDLETPTGTWRYYDGMLYMMALLHASGEFKIYPPKSHHHGHGHGHGHGH